MPKILVVGATDYIGQALSLSLLRTGTHTVYGIARSDTKATELSRLEIFPVLCPDLVQDLEPFLSALKTHNISVVVSCGADGEAQELLDVVIEAGRRRLNAYQNAGIHGPKLAFVYTSGTWTHGSSFLPVTDLDVVGSSLSPTQPPKLVSWRPGQEYCVLAAKDVLDVMVVRPALVYGRSHPIWKSFFDVVVQGSKRGDLSVDIPLDKGRPALIHVDDVASGLRAAVDKLPLISGTGVYPVFDLVGQSESMQDILDALARAVGYKGEVKLIGSNGDSFEEAMSVSANIDAGRAKTLLEWQPKRAGLVDGMDVYAHAFMAT
ncbi:NAD(P)-binding protein [Tothia fuscella]|uniref:NAD(P)-binding protein n=1 Tax=Tothia fuscella TaxID=1048955 RepID=A0A9P4NNH9_9PEZI|nr:NAD(P)-binding protein [Tothia fuscella]